MPQKLMNSKYFKMTEVNTIEAGVYELKNVINQFKIHLIVINQLNIEDRTFNLLKFSRGKAKRNFINFLVNHINEEKYARVLTECYIIDPQETIEMSHGEVMQLVSVNDNIRYAIEKIGLEKVINAVGLEKVIETMGIQIFFQIPKEKMFKLIDEAESEGKITKEIADKLRELYSLMP